MKSDPAFLATLKTGDTVILARKRASNEIATVRCTPTQVIANGHIRFNKKTGWVRGDDTYGAQYSILPATPEAIENIRYTRRLVRLMERIRTISIDDLRRLTSEEVATLEDFVGRICKQGEGVDVHLPL